MKRNYILGLADLIEGKTINAAQITETVKRKPGEVNRDLHTLVVTGKLKRIPGIASSPATYCLPDYAAQLMKGSPNNVL